MDKINLRELFITPYDYLPDLVDSNNCIYRILNLVNNKSYIGQTKWLYGRFCLSAISHKISYSNSCRYCDNSLRLYNAIRKYKSRNFEVSVLEKDISIELLNDREIYFVAKYDSYYSGYNMNLGGNYCTQLHSEESISKRLITNLNNHCGVLSCNTEEAIKNRILSNKLNHNGVLSFNTPEANRNKSITNLFISIYNNIDKLKANNLKITASNYVWLILDTNHRTRNIANLLNSINYLRNDPRWTDEMEFIFSDIERNGIYNLEN